MTDTEISEALRRRGVAEHLAKSGRKGLITRYERFVDEVENGYELGFEDYSNDLDLRRIIGELGLDDDDAVEAADERLDAVLTPLDDPIVADAPDGAFWAYGYPANAGDELMEDLRRMGLLPDEDDDDEDEFSEWEEDEVEDEDDDVDDEDDDFDDESYDDEED